MSTRTAPPEQSDPIVYRYVGPGWFPSVPARDLTQADVDALPTDAPLAWLVDQGVYTKEK